KTSDPGRRRSPDCLLFLTNRSEVAAGDAGDDGRCHAIDDAHRAKLHGKSSATGTSGNSTLDETVSEEVRRPNLSRVFCFRGDQPGRFLVCACWICAASLNSRFAISILPSWR